MEDQVARLVARGFQARSFERYPGFLAVVRDGFVALLQPGEEGLKLFTAAGRLLGDQIGVRVIRGEAVCFQAKGDEVTVDSEMDARYRQFCEELQGALL
ncbi:MAG: hypothetical protein ACYC6M_00110 [Terriglobales bacterium]